MSAVAIAPVVALALLTSSIAVTSVAAVAPSRVSSVESEAEFGDDDLTIWDFHVGAGTPGGSTGGQDGPSDANLVVIDPMKPVIPCYVGELARCDFGVSAAPDDPPVGVAPITIADLASFTPAVGELVVQPENWGVLGIPTNFVATATDHIQEGTLLDQPVEVRWRPVGFTFDYGDGTVVTTSDSGAMWSSSEDDWTTTSTSHEYQERGEYTATVTVTFEADISTAAGWATVPGTLELAAPAEGVRIFEVQTVLTRGDCIEYPNDPGCAP